MRIESENKPIELDDFARRFTMRAGNLMWFLGAGASAAAGIPTALDMVWEFKQKLYVSQRRVSLNSVSDLSNPAVRSQLQSFIEASENLPALGSSEEYATLFETVWPSESDRKTYIQGKVAGAKPSYGHFALATLMRAKLARLVWTTNFDPLVADACAKIYDGTGPLTTVGQDAPDLAFEAISSERWPIEVKLHGDFRSRRLKNTPDELRQQDARLRQAFVDSCRRWGLIVIGYSGRDDSVMDALTEAVTQPNSFPGGLFWLHRGDDPPSPRVQSFLRAASAQEIDGGLVGIENFDETLRDLVRLIDGIDAKFLTAFASERRWWSPPAKASGTKSYPVVRLNALPIQLAPTVCRRVVCGVGGHAEARAAVDTANVDILVARTRAGVLAFGSDSDVRAAFERYNISNFDLHSIEARRLRYESGERGLLRQALSRALAREHNLDLSRRRTSDHLVPSTPTDPVWKPLERIVGQLAGTVPGGTQLS